MIPVIMVLVWLAACGPSATEGGFDSPNSAAKMYAIEQAARQGDQAAICRIVELLDADDPAVRFMAIAALERLTGQTLGYRHYDSAFNRSEAVKRWIDACNAGTIVPMMSSPDLPPAAATAVHANPANG